MLAVEKSKDLIEQISRVERRMDHIKEVKSQLFSFITQVQVLYSSFSQKIHKEMIVFQEKIVKNSLYSTQKTSYIINLAKIYREFSIQLEKNSKINLINLQRIRNDEIMKQQEKLKKKCELFLKEFQQYLQAEKSYNSNYNTYNDKCNDLDQVIRRYRSYQDPIAFYNQILTNEYIQHLDKQYNDCTNSETTVVNHTQGLDQTRKWMCEHVKEINEYYVILLHFYLGIIEALIACIVDPKKDANLEKNKLGLRTSQNDSVDNQQLELEKLNNLYSSELNNEQHVEDNILVEYSELFKKTFSQTELNSDYKFFYDRCESIRNKKLKTTEEVFNIQTLLIKQLANQSVNYNNFEKEYKLKERDIFTNNGIDSFKKRFRKYFGPNFMEILELCFIIIDRQKKSMEKIGKSNEQMQQKLGKLIDNKQQSIKLFDKRTKMILDEHLKLKEKTYSNGNTVDSQQLRIFKDSISSSFNQLKKSFLQLEKNQSQVDSLFYTNLKSHYETILKEAVSKNLNRTLQKQKNRLNILNSLNVDSEIVLILKQDTRYEMLMNQCPKPNLYSTFQSLTKKKEYDETKKLLQMKENRLKNMIRSKRGCCGITTSQPIKNNVLSQHNCKLVTNQKLKGVLNITSTGLIFEENTWNPFSDGLRLMIPQSDIIAFDTKSLNGKEYVEIVTDFGNLTFESKQCTEIIESMQKNITFKVTREGSQKGKRNDSSSFLKNNTSTEYKLTYDKTANASSDGKFPTKTEKNQPKSKTAENIGKDFIKKWKENTFLSEHFTRIIDNLPEKSQKRKDYMYNNGHSKFLLKERRDYQVEGRDIILVYEWKICFPDSPMLHSFKHNQKVHIEGINKDLRVRIVTGPFYEEQLFIRNKFYKEIEEMNSALSKFIVNTLEKEADVLIEAENDPDKSLESCNIVLEDINIDDRQSKYEKGDNTLRNSRLQKVRSSIVLKNS